MSSAKMAAIFPGGRWVENAFVVYHCYLNKSMIFKDYITSTRIIVRLRHCPWTQILWRIWVNDSAHVTLVVCLLINVTAWSGLTLYQLTLKQHNAHGQCKTDRWSSTFTWLTYSYGLFYMLFKLCQWKLVCHCCRLWVSRPPKSWYESVICVIGNTLGTTIQWYRPNLNNIFWNIILNYKQICWLYLVRKKLISRSF